MSKIISFRVTDSFVDQARERFKMTEDDSKELTAQLNRVAYSLFVRWLTNDRQASQDDVSLAEVVSKLTDNVSDLTDAVDDVTAMVKDLRDNALKNELDIFNSYQDEMTYTELRAERDKLDDRASELLNENEALKHELEDLKKKSKQLSKVEQVRDDDDDWDRSWLDIDLLSDDW